MDWIELVLFLTKYGIRACNNSQSQGILSQTKLDTESGCQQDQEGTVQSFSSYHRAIVQQGLHYEYIVLTCNYNSGKRVLPGVLVFWPDKGTYISCAILSAPSVCGAWVGSECFALGWRPLSYQGGPVT